MFVAHKVREFQQRIASLVDIIVSPSDLKSPHLQRERESADNEKNTRQREGETIYIFSLARLS